MFIVCRHQNLEDTTPPKRLCLSPQHTTVSAINFPHHPTNMHSLSPEPIRKEREYGRTTYRYIEYCVYLVTFYHYSYIAHTFT